MAPQNGPPRLPSLVSKPEFERAGRPRLWGGSRERSTLNVREQGTGEEEDRMEGKREALLFIISPLLDPGAIGCWERQD